MRLVLVALFALANTATAHADATSDDRVGLVVEADAQGAHDRLRQHLAAQLRRAGFIAVDAPMSRDALSTLANCFIIDDLVCARGVVEARSKAPRLLYVRVDKADDALTIELTWFSAGNAPLVEKATCDGCSEADGAALARQAGGALRHLAKTAPAPTRTEAAYEKPEATPSRVLPVTLIAGGTAVAIAGGICLYYGLREDPSEKYVYPQLTPVGISLLAVGVGAAVTGYILLPSGKERSHPVAAVTSGGAYVGWSGAF